MYNTFPNYHQIALVLSRFHNLLFQQSHQIIHLILSSALVHSSSPHYLTANNETTVEQLQRETLLTLTIHTFAKSNRTTCADSLVSTPGITTTGSSTALRQRLPNTDKDTRPYEIASESRLRNACHKVGSFVFPRASSDVVVVVGKEKGSQANSHRQESREKKSLSERAKSKILTLI